MRKAILLSMKSKIYSFVVDKSLKTEEFLTALMRSTDGRNLRVIRKQIEKVSKHKISTNQVQIYIFYRLEVLASRSMPSVARRMYTQQKLFVSTNRCKKYSIHRLKWSLLIQHLTHPSPSLDFIVLSSCGHL